MRSEREQAGQRFRVEYFLKESNNIEGVWDKSSLNQALQAWDYIISKDYLSIENTLQTHRILMVNKVEAQDLGALRQYPVWISGVEGKPWYALPELVDNWIKSVNTTVINFQDDEDLIKKQHVDFEVIHPFSDGNGRTGRILMNWTRTKVELPILIIKEREKQQYYKWFRDS